MSKQKTAYEKLRETLYPTKPEKAKGYSRETKLEPNVNWKNLSPALQRLCEVCYTHQSPEKLKYLCRGVLMEMSEDMRALLLHPIWEKNTEHWLVLRRYVSYLDGNLKYSFCLPRADEQEILKVALLSLVGRRRLYKLFCQHKAAAKKEQQQKEKVRTIFHARQLSSEVHHVGAGLSSQGPYDPSRGSRSAR